MFYLAASLIGNLILRLVSLTCETESFSRGTTIRPTSTFNV